MNRLVLIDGNAILHRAFHALPTSLTNSKGELTNAVYGFVSILFKVIEDLKPTHLVVTFDRAAPTFRNELFKDYQSQRPEMDQGLIPQVDKIHKVMEAMEIPIYELDGYEADDVLGTIAQQVQSSSISRHAELVSASTSFRHPEFISGSRNNPDLHQDDVVRDDNKIVDEVVIVTGDRDLLQLVNHKVKLFMPVKGLSEGKLFGEKEAQERMGVKPSQIADLKALMGDASDNYPGVAGIGPKTACALLKEFGSVENIYKNLNKIKNASLVAKLTTDKENALLSHKLATVVTDAPIRFDSKKAQMHDLSTKQAIEVFGELGFKTLLKRLLNMHGKGESVEKKNVKEKGKEKEQLGLF